MAAGDMSTEAISGIVEATGNLEEALQNVNQSGDRQAGDLEGITPVKQGIDTLNKHAETVEEILGVKGWFHSMLEEITSHNDSSEEGDKEARELQQGVIDSLGDMIDYNEVTSKETKMDKKKKGKVGSSSKFDDLKDLPWEFATLGAVLSNAITNKDKDKKGGGISGFFKGLMEGVGGIAALGVALLAFAGAALIFNFVDWGKAVIGMLAFTVFTIGMVAIAKVLAKDQKNLVEFAKASLIMSAALGVFAISLWISSLVFSGKAGKLFGIEIPSIDLLGAVAALVTFGIFIGGLVGLSYLVGDNSKNMVEFAKGAILMSAALVTFSVALWISSYIMSGKPISLPFGLGELPAISLDGAIAALTSFGIFIAGTAALAALVGNAKGDFKNFAEGALLMSAALVAFSVSLLISSYIFSAKDIQIGEFTIPKIDIIGAIAAFVSFGVFVAAFTGLAILANKFAGDIKTFTLTTILMSASLVAFAVAMCIASNMFAGVATTISGGEAGDFVLPQVDLGGAIAAFVSFGLFIAGFIGLAALANAFGGNLAVFTGITLLMALSLATFSFAIGVAALVMTGGEIQMGEEKFAFKLANPFVGALAMLAEALIFIAAFSAMGLACIWVGPTAVLAAGVIIPISLALLLFSQAVGMAGMVYQGGTITVGDTTYNLPPYNQNAVNAMFDLMHNFIDKFADIADSIGVKGAIILGILGKSILPLIEGMDKMINIVIKAAQNKEEIESIVNGTGTAIDHLMDPVLFMLLGPKLDGNGGMMAVANGMSVKGAILLKLIAESIGPLVDSMDKMIDVVLKAATMGADGQDIQQLVATGNANLDLIMFGPDKTSGFMAMFVRVAEETKNTSKNAAEAMQAMPAVVDALSGLLDIIIKAQDFDKDQITSAVDSLKVVSGFLVSFMKTVNEIIPGGVGGAISKFFGGDPLKKLEEAHKLLQKGGTYYNIIADLCEIAKGFSGNGFENLAKVAVVGSFTTDILKSSEHFKNVMENVSAGIDKYKNPDKLKTLAGALDNIAKADISHSFDSLDELMTKSVQLNNTAEAMERIANQMARIKKEASSDPIGSAADKLGRLTSDVWGNIQEKGTAILKGNADGEEKAKSVPKGQELQFIAQTIRKWDEGGVKVYGITTADKEKAVRTLSI